MKRLLALLLALTLAVGLFACDGTQEESTQATQSTEGGESIEGVFSVGFGREDVTPSYAVPLGGYGNSEKRMSEGFYDLLYTTCIAFTDAEGETVLLFYNDLIKTSGNVRDICRPIISAATGVPEDHIMISSTHNHSSPDTSSTDESMTTYVQELAMDMLNAAQAAMEDRKPAEMYITSTTVEGVGFTRHYVMDDGSYCGDNFDGTGTSIVGYANEADRTLQLIKFTREGGRDIVMANFQSHPHSAGGSKKYYMTADMVGVMRDRLEAETDCLFSYFTGASGNVNSASKISADNGAADYIGRGEILAQTAIDAASSYTRAETGKVQILTSGYTADINHTEDDKLADAQIIARLFKDTNDAARCQTEAAQYGIKSAYHANAIVTRSSMAQTSEITEIDAFSVGDVAFALASYEMFHQSGSYIKENSPFAMTFIVTLANGHNGYIPTEDTFEYYSYECCLSNYVPGTAEALADQYVGLLTELYATK